MAAKTIEEYIGILKGIAEKIKNSDLTLDESMKLYKEGLDAAVKAEKLLNSYKEELELLNGREAENE